jgi:hypothetical protein
MLPVRINFVAQVFDQCGNFRRTFGSFGNGRGQFYHPNGIVFDRTANVVIADDDNHRVQVLRVDGSLVTTFGARGKDDDQFEFVGGVSMDCTGRLVVLDWGNRRLQMFEFAVGC